MWVPASSEAILRVTFTFLQTPSLSNLKHGGGENAKGGTWLYQDGRPSEGPCKLNKYNQMVFIAPVTTQSDKEEEARDKNVST